MTNDKLTIPVPDEQGLRKLAEELIAAQNTVTLATAKDDVPWAAPVYYVNLEFIFYFFSDPDSRHIRESLQARRAAGAIFHQASTWREIRGIQMTGEIAHVSPGWEALKALRAYLKKFPFTEEFFERHQELDLEAFAKRFRVRLYRFQPMLLYYMDNRIRFSFREKVTL
jgi:uncharacterized protein YhbP (UPF0306 family)